MGLDWEVTADVARGTAILANGDLFVAKVAGELHSPSHGELHLAIKNWTDQPSANEALDVGLDESTRVQDANGNTIKHAPDVFCYGGMP